MDNMKLRQMMIESIAEFELQCLEQVSGCLLETVF